MLVLHKASFKWSLYKENRFGDNFAVFSNQMFSKHHNHYTNRIVVSLHRLTATVTDGISFGGIIMAATKTATMTYGWHHSAGVMSVALGVIDDVKS